MIMYLIFIVTLFAGTVVFIWGLSMILDLLNQILSLLSAESFLPSGVIVMMIGFFIIFAVPLFIFVRIRTSGCSLRFDKNPPAKGVFSFIYRDGSNKDIYGTRIPGLGMFNIPKLGMIMDVGRKPQPGSVYSFGDKKIRFALQDINYTPNPKYSSFYEYLTSLGFNLMDDVQDVLTGYNPELMAKVWHNMCSNKKETYGDRIVQSIQEMTSDDVEANNQLWSKSKTGGLKIGRFRIRRR